MRASKKMEEDEEKEEEKEQEEEESDRRRRKIRRKREIVLNQPMTAHSWKKTCEIAIAESRKKKHKNVSRSGTYIMPKLLCQKHNS